MKKGYLILVFLMAASFGASAQKMMMKQLPDLTSDAFQFCIQSNYEGVMLKVRDSNLYGEKEEDYWLGESFYFESLGGTGDSIDNKEIRVYAIGPGRLRDREDVPTFKYIEGEEHSNQAWVFEPTGDEAWICIKNYNTGKYLTLGRKTDDKYEVTMADKKTGDHPDQRWRLMRIK